MSQVLVAPQQLSAHAIMRFQNRWAERLNIFTAFDVALRERLPAATFVEFEDGTRQQIWRTHDGILLVVRAGVVMTVLPANTQRANRRPVK